MARGTVGSFLNLESAVDRFLLLLNLNTTAMDGRSRTSLCFATPGLLPNGGSVENVGTIFNQYILYITPILRNFYAAPLLSDN